MAQDEIHFGDVGTQFERTVKDGDVAVDLSAATTKEIKFKPPSGPTKVKSAIFLTDGTDGILTYTTIADDLDELGKWELQVHVVIAAGDFNTDVEGFVVHRNI